MKQPSQLRSRLALLAGGAILATSAWADGTLTGTVRDSVVGASLEGARVTLDTGVVAVADRAGFFRLPDVPAGSHTVRVDYLGLEPVIQTVTVRDDETTALRFELTMEAVELDKLVVRAGPSGTARAVNLQRNADSYRNVVASDFFGRFPDGNAAEALSRLPGISIERDQGEGRFVVIRGIDPNLNSISIDGVALASPSADERKTLLDTIPTEVMERIEVTKAVLPSQPGDSIGGHIEISSPSAFDREGRLTRLILSGIYTDLTEDFGFEGTVAYSDRFGPDGKVGLFLTANYSERGFGSDNQESDEWELADAPEGGEFYAQMGSMEFREYDLTRTRIGLAANLEYRPHDRASYFIRGSYNDYKDVEMRQLGEFDFGEEVITALSETSQTNDEVEVVKEFKDRQESMRVAAFAAGGQNLFGDYTLDYKVGYSYAEEDTPYDFESVYELEDVTSVRIDGTDTSNPTVTHLGGADYTDAAAYEFDEIADASQLVEEDDLSFQANLRGEFETPVFRYFQTGFLYRQKTKTSDLEEFASDDNPAEVDTLDAFAKTDRRDPYGSGFPHQAPSIRRFFLQNEADFAMERDLEKSSVEDYDIDEDVSAAYFMVGLEFDALELIAGARVERTEMSSQGFTYLDEDESVTESHYGKDYTNWMPGLHAKYTIDENLIARASWTNTIARPTFGQNYPGITVDDENAAERGNPLLDPYEASNFDLSLEYYGEHLGVFSMALFYKDIRNFIYEQTSEPEEGPYDELTTFLNGPSGEIYGVEFSFQRQIDFVPGLGIYAAATFSHGEAEVLAADLGDANRELPFVKQADFVGQLALTYESGPFFVRLAGSRRSDYLDEVGGEPIEDRYIDGHFQLDLTASYYLSNELTISAAINNLTNEPLRAYWGESGRLSQFEEYGWWGTLSVQWNH